MLELSIRGGDDGTSVYGFGPETWRNTNRRVVTQQAVLLTLEQQSVAGIFHGYNVDEALPAFSLVETNLNGTYGVVLGCCWPGSKKAGYWWAEHRADEAGRRFAKILRDLPYRTLDLQGHSCGCRVALEAVRSGLRVRNLVLAAAAVDNECVQLDKKYGPYLEANCEQVLVAYSKNDAVLKKAFRASSWLKRAARLRLWGDDCKALGYTGPQNPERCPANLRAVEFPTIDRHGAYKENAEYFSAWKNLAR